MTETTKERRKTQRVDYKVPCRIHFDGHEISGESVNVSLRGARAALAGSVPDSTVCTFELRPLGERIFELTAESISTDGVGTGFQFQAMDLESLSYLRQVVRHNAEQELDINADLEGFLRTPQRASSSMKGAGSWPVSSS